MNNIPNISFDSSEKTTDIEFLRISELFERVEENPNHDPLKPHRITFFALLIVMEGEGMHQVDLENYLLKKGSVLKIAKGQVHAFQENLSYDGYLVVFTEDFVLKFFSKSTIDFISHLYNYHISDPLVEGSNFNESFLALIAQELNNENTYAQRNIIAKMLELYLLKLERVSHLAISTKRNTEQYPLFFQFKNLVEERYMDTRNVKDYAEYMSVSAKQLNAVVQNFTLNTAKHFIDEYVVLEIKRAILSTNNSLKEIAYELGFDEVTNFTKFFKKHTGITPKEYKSSL
ncbi:AraC-type DNA-binding protein [Reichenbachiella agariperforans]|uniref:AraC-type DNA-binding protein n=1 Tax=Reichenbachiella agariperforans TaxID=156994 RepID=A0A1M6N3R3_REIAG|nr:helix-turn-helix domain-containing protein [Reichenbachiella agariperforans]SHJ90308.1 AraC-type DNA-binding protein [Reichenbachiella agariperforans]